MNISSDARRRLGDGRRKEKKRRERERGKERGGKVRDVTVELFGPNRRQPPRKGSMQIHARLGARHKGGEGGSRTVMEGTFDAIGIRGYRRMRARARKPWR